MRLNLLEKLKCPDCGHHPLDCEAMGFQGKDVVSGSILCPNCSGSFRIKHGIPILLPTFLQIESLNPSQNHQKINQISHYNQVGLTELEICRPHGLGKIYNYLIKKKFQTILSLWGGSLKDKQVVDICCGSGMDLEYLYKAGADVLGVDISLGALLGAQERARRYGLQYELIVADSENLPLVDSSFEAAFVHDGLHHLEHPEKGFMEMARVAREGLLLTEPAQSVVTRIAIQFGMAEAVEESGNLVHRFTIEELQKFATKAGLVTLAQKRYFMYYQQDPLPIFKWFEHQATFSLFTTAFKAFNYFFGPWGNKIAMTARR